MTLFHSLVPVIQTIRGAVSRVGYELGGEGELSKALAFHFSFSGLLLLMSLRTDTGFLTTKRGKLPAITAPEPRTGLHVDNGHRVTTHNAHLQCANTLQYTLSFISQLL